MDATTYENTISEIKLTAGRVVSGPLAQGIAGIGAVALSIIGLAQILPDFLASIATIAIGAALMLESGAIMTRFSALVRETSKGVLETGELGVGVTTEFLGGVAGIALGILSLVNLAPLILIPVAAIAFGATLVFSMGVMVRLNHLEMEISGEHEMVKRVAREAVRATSGVQLLLGLGAITLGILALIGVQPLILSLVSTLIVGSSILLSGSAVTARLWATLRL